eukprot:6591828-Heterocapsa_arctica.AAC.1
MVFDRGSGLGGTVLDRSTPPTRSVVLGTSRTVAGSARGGAGRRRLGGCRRSSSACCSQC